MTAFENMKSVLGRLANQTRYEPESAVGPTSGCTIPEAAYVVAITGHKGLFSRKTRKQLSVARTGRPFLAAAVLPFVMGADLEAVHRVLGIDRSQTIPALVEIALEQEWPTLDPSHPLELALRFNDFDSPDSAFAALEIADHALSNVPEDEKLARRDARTRGEASIVTWNALLHSGRLLRDFQYGALNQQFPWVDGEARSN